MGSNCKLTQPVPLPIVVLVCNCITYTRFNWNYTSGCAWHTIGRELPYTLWGLPLIYFIFARQTQQWRGLQTRSYGDLYANYGELYEWVFSCYKSMSYEGKIDAENCEGKQGVMAAYVLQVQFHQYAYYNLHIYYHYSIYTCVYIQLKF